MRYFILLSVFLITSCDEGTTGQDFVSYPVYAVGNSQNAAFTSDDGWTVNLSSAELVIGSIKMCSHVPALFKEDSLRECGQVLGEMTTAKAFDFLSDSEVLIGTMNGITGQIHSTFYNHGWIWLTSQGESVSISDDLDGMSAVITGSATKDASEFDFELEIALKPNRKGDDLISGIGCEGNVTTAVQRLEVRSDPRQWLRKLSFDLLSSCDDEVCGVNEGTTAWNSLFYGIVQGGQLEFTWK